jgi:hypothetical protein
MTNFRRTIHNIFVWSYERGTLQYDIICALILAFVFFVPPSCFVAKNAGKLTPPHPNTAIASQNVRTTEYR